MTFAVEELTQATIEDIDVLSQKNRPPDEGPGVKITLEMTLSNHALSALDGSLKGWLFTRSEANAPRPLATKRKDNQTETLAGVEPISDLPNLSNIGKHVKTLKWSEEVTGLAVEIRFATSRLLLDDASASGFKIQPKEGGTVVVRFAIEAPNATEVVFAKLAKFKSRGIQFRITQHAPQQATLPDSEDAEQEAEDEEPRPFPKDGSAAEQAPPQSVTTEVGSKERRTGRRVVGSVE